MTAPRKTTLLLGALLSGVLSTAICAAAPPQAAAQNAPQPQRVSAWDARWVDYAWYTLLILIGIAALWRTSTFVLEQVPGAFVMLSACPDGSHPRTAPTNHSAHAVFDDAPLADGIALYAELALRRLARVMLLYTDVRCCTFRVWRR